MKKLGFGCMRLPLIDSKEQKSLDFEQINEMVDRMICSGFNYFDTAFPYHEGASETAVREFLVKRYRRDEFLLATKMPLWKITSKDDFEVYFRMQLNKCGVDYFDYYLLHNINTQSYSTVVKYDGFAYLRSLKEDNRAKKIGFSFHGTADLLQEILSTHSYLDFVQLQINYMDWESPVVQSRLCYEVARKYNVPIIVMEPVKGGSLVNIPPAAQNILRAVNPFMSNASWAIRFCASLEGVMLVLSGMSNLQQIDDNISFMKDFTPLSETEQMALANARALMLKSSAIACTDCKYCVSECPKKIPIPDYFSLYNNAISSSRVAILALYYNNFLSEHGAAKDCIACGKCEKACPQHLPIIKCMKNVSKKFDSAYFPPPIKSAKTIKNIKND